MLPRLAPAAGGVLLAVSSALLRLSPTARDWL